METSDFIQSKTALNAFLKGAVRREKRRLDFPSLSGDSDRQWSKEIINFKDSQ